MFSCKVNPLEAGKVPGFIALYASDFFFFYCKMVPILILVKRYNGLRGCPVTFLLSFFQITAFTSAVCGDKNLLGCSTSAQKEIIFCWAMELFP